MSEHLTAGITHPKKVNPSRGSNSASRSSGHSDGFVSTSVSLVCGSRPLRFAVSRKLIIFAARFPAISEPVNNHTFRLMTTGRMARSQILLPRGTALSPGISSVHRVVYSVSTKVVPVRRFYLYAYAVPFVQHDDDGDDSHQSCYGKSAPEYLLTYTDKYAHR